MLKLIAVLAFQSESAVNSEIADANVILDLSRQYKTMQTKLTNKVKKLEQEVSQLKEDLGMVYLYLKYNQTNEAI